MESVDSVSYQIKGEKQGSEHPRYFQAASFAKDALISGIRE